jgi:hypothetical protein
VSRVTLTSTIKLRRRGSDKDICGHGKRKCWGSVNYTSQLCFAGSTSRLMTMAAWSCQRLHSQGGLSVIDFSSVCSFGSCCRSYLIQTCLLESVYFCLEIVARQVANQSKFGDSRHHHSKGSVLCVRMQRHGISSAFIYFMHHL